MAENGHLVVYLIVEKGTNGNKKSYWRPLGAAYPCRDGSLNIKLDIHPGLTFNARQPKSNGEREEIDIDPEREFECDVCERVSSNENAHVLSGGGVVCDKCFVERYKDCPNCNQAFPKSIPSEVCPTCR